MRIEKKIILFIVVFIIGTILLGNSDVRANFDTGIPAVYVDDYNQVTFCETNRMNFGHVTYRITADLRKVDTMQVPHIIMIQRCCDNPILNKSNYVMVRINGIPVYSDYEYVIVNDFNEGRYFLPTIDVSSYRRGNAGLEFEVYGWEQRCQNCGRVPQVRVKHEGLKFYDYRAKVTDFPQSINVMSGGNTSLRYAYSDNTYNVCWGIRCSGENDFTMLAEGANRDGLIASGVNSGEIVLSNIPGTLRCFDVGAFVFDRDGDLPAGTTENNTPFFTRINVDDKEAPTIDIRKRIDTEAQKVFVEIIGSDNVGLHETAYSWDGGNTFEASNTRGFSEAGTYHVAVRDIYCNVTTRDVHIDAIEIEKVKPKNTESEPDINDKDTEIGKGNSGGIVGDKSANETENIKSDSIDTIKAQGAGSTSLNKIKDNLNENSNSKTTVDVSLNSTEEVKQTGSAGTTIQKLTPKSKTSKSNSTADKSSKDAFERIRNNSEKYIISMKETSKEEPKAAEASKPKINLETIEDKSNPENFKNKENEQINDYIPEEKEKPVWVFTFIIIGLLLFVLILLFVLFFGVIILSDKDMDIMFANEGDGFRVPIAISFVVFKDGEKSVCFREILSRYDVVYVRFGILFNYLYENEKIKIMTRFKGEEKKEIATEIIHREIIIGSKKGGKR